MAELRGSFCDLPGQSGSCPREVLKLGPDAAVHPYQNDVARHRRLFALWYVPESTRNNLCRRYGKYNTVHTRFMRWARAGALERIFADPLAYKRNQYLMVDSTIVRAHQQAAADGKGAPPIRLWCVPEVD